MRRSLVALAIGVILLSGVQARAESYPADNSGKNVRDRSGGTLTSGDQGNSKGDLEITQAIRKAVMADKNLSMDAQNVKIITTDGIVTLRGPVKSAEEKSTIGEKAKAVAGVMRVDNQLEIASR
jgi:hyperosmotically inducible periplasmic protein